MELRGIEPESAPSEYEEEAPWKAPKADGGGPEPRSRRLRGGGQFPLAPGNFLLQIDSL